MTDEFAEFVSALILIIDDEETARLLTRACLEEEGFRVEEAPNGEDGLERVRAVRPDLILLDVMMPGMDGFEVCQRIRADPSLCNTPVIIVTGQEDTKDVQRGFAAGATDFLTKPVNWDLLPNRIRYVLRSTRLGLELRHARDIAEKASAAKSVLLSTMGHELRTPLNSIIGFSELMEQQAFGPIGSPEYESYVHDIHASGVRLLNAVNDILEIVSSESGDIELRRKTVNVVNLVKSVIKKVATEANASGVQIVNDVSDESVCIRGDEERLGIALLNLVSNAVKFSEAGGNVRVSTTVSQNDELVLAITDRGIGISAEDLPRVMMPFEQVDVSLARKYEGLGLGIPVACAIVKLHGAKVDYESALGKGTTVRITLPAKNVVPSNETGFIDRSSKLDQRADKRPVPVQSAADQGARDIS